jgi:hypothetical protein
MAKVKETQRTGKEGELRVMGELLRQGFNVYTPMVDIEGTDCVIKQKSSYLDIQIKTRERARLLLFDVKHFTPRDNFFIICYSLKEPNDFWVIPSGVYAKHSRSVNKNTRLRLVLGGEGSRMRRELHLYRNIFHQLRDLSPRTRPSDYLRSATGTNEKRSGWQYLKKRYPNLEAAEAKLKEALAKGAKPSSATIYRNLKRYWEKRSKVV